MSDGRACVLLNSSAKGKNMRCRQAPFPLESPWSVKAQQLPELPDKAVVCGKDTTSTGSTAGQAPLEEDQIAQRSEPLSPRAESLRSARSAQVVSGLKARMQKATRQRA